MLLKFHDSMDLILPEIRKQIINGKDKGDVSQFGAFPRCASLRFCVKVPKKLGSSAVVLRINRDGEDARDIPLSFESSVLDSDEYSLTLSLAELCGDESDGLFYYEFLFLRGFDTLFTDSVNNVDFSLEPSSGSKFRLLVFSEDYTTPEWFAGGTMYHIFVDRFCRGDGKVSLGKDTVLNDDWYNGGIQYGEYPGAPVKNNVFFGGNLWGVAEKLDYLDSLGIKVIYLSPIFKAYSNHKYDTGDYMQVDEAFGGEEALCNLLRCAEKHGIKIILDGVFNHTGDDSRYFNRYGNYDGIGAYQSPDSKYFHWYNFKEYPDKYESWWGVEVLPKLNLRCRSCFDFLVGEGGVVDKYTKMGIGGWRLDVADELTDEFLSALRTTVKNGSKGNGIVIGEVWENAADKIAYGKRRRYLRGDQLDSVMNYPVRNAILSLVIDGDTELFYNILTELYSSYPKCTSDALMNLLGTHDTERILTLLGGDGENGRTNAELACASMTSEQYEKGVRLLKMASTVQFTVFGVPSVFYGDEAGIEGYHDPFCRKPFPWGRENTELLSHYRKLGEIRKNEKVFRHGDFGFVRRDDGFVAYSRADDGEIIVVAINRSESDYSFALDGRWKDLYTSETFAKKVPLGPCAFRILKRMN